MSRLNQLIAAALAITAVSGAYAQSGEAPYFNADTSGVSKVSRDEVRAQAREAVAHNSLTNVADLDFDQKATSHAQRSDVRHAGADALQHGTLAVGE